MFIFTTKRNVFATYMIKLALVVEVTCKNQEIKTNDGCGHGTTVFLSQEVDQGPRRCVHGGSQDIFSSPGGASSVDQKQDRKKVCCDEE